MRTNTRFNASVRNPGRFIAVNPSFGKVRSFTLRNKCGFVVRSAIVQFHALHELARHKSMDSGMFLDQPARHKWHILKEQPPPTAYDVGRVSTDFTAKGDSRNEKNSRFTSGLRFAIGIPFCLNFTQRHRRNDAATPGNAAGLCAKAYTYCLRMCLRPDVSGAAINSREQRAGYCRFEDEKGGATGAIHLIYHEMMCVVPVAPPRDSPRVGPDPGSGPDPGPGSGLDPLLACVGHADRDDHPQGIP